MTQGTAPRIRGALWCSGRWLLCGLLLSWLCGTGAAEDHATAMVKRFYERHLRGDMSFTLKGLQAKAEWLTPSFYAILDRQAASPASPDEVPLIDGDPFTDTQEYPTSFSIVGEHTAAHQTIVTVALTLPQETRRIDLVLVRSPEGWKIDDIRYADGTSLRALANENPAPPKR
jgi:hypothetical protein